MAKPNPIIFFKQSLKSESYYADELINIYFLRPIATVIVWFLYTTSVTPNQVTIAAIFFGLTGAIFYTFVTPITIAIAGLLVLAKDIFDDADGQLARAKQLYSRRGRFLDSIGDFIVDVAVFTSITYVTYQSFPNNGTVIIGIISFIGVTLRVSYHVYYQVSFFHIEDRYKLNRITEDINDEDRKGDHVTLTLQKIFILIYGWQDRIMFKIDRWCKGTNFDDNLSSTWYSDRFALRLSGMIGFGTEFTLLAICSMLNELRTYLLLNVFMMNGIWLFSIFYRRYILSSNLK